MDLRSDLYSLEIPLFSPHACQISPKLGINKPRGSFPGRIPDLRAFLRIIKYVF